MPNMRPHNTTTERMDLVRSVKDRAPGLAIGLVSNGQWPRVAQVELDQNDQLAGRCIDILPIEGICLKFDGTLIVRNRNDYRDLLIDGQRDSILNSILARFDELLPAEA